MKGFSVSFPRSSQRAGLHLIYLTSFVNVPVSLPVSSFKVQTPLLPGRPACLSFSHRFTSTAPLWVGWLPAQAIPGSTSSSQVPQDTRSTRSSLDLHLQPDGLRTSLKPVQSTHTCELLLSGVLIEVCPPTPLARGWSYQSQY